jgi:hypothetical protein
MAQHTDTNVGGMEVEERKIKYPMGTRVNSTITSLQGA